MTQAQTMTEYEMVEQLAAKMHITQEEARAALEAGEWNTLTATHLLEQEKFRRMQALNAFASDDAEGGAEAQAEPDDSAAQAEAEPARAAATRARGKTRGALRRIGRAIMDLIAVGNRNRFAIHRNGEPLLEMPVTVLAVLLLFSFGTCALLLVVGLLAGCRYSVNGKFIGAEA